MPSVIMLWRVLLWRVLPEFYECGMGTLFMYVCPIAGMRILVVLELRECLMYLSMEPTPASAPSTSGEYIRTGEVSGNR